MEKSRKTLDPREPSSDSIRPINVVPLDPNLLALLALLPSRISLSDTILLNSRSKLSTSHGLRKHLNKASPLGDQAT